MTTTSVRRSRPHTARAIVDAAIDEKTFQRTVIELARLHGWRVHWTHDSRRSPEGWPDLVLCKPPRLIVAELKTEQGRLTTDQRDWLCLLGNVPGVEVGVWRPSGFDELERLLQGGRG